MASGPTSSAERTNRRLEMDVAFLRPIVRCCVISKTVRWWFSPLMTMDQLPQLAARVSVAGSSRDFGEGGPHHAFALERSSATGGHLILRANLSPQPADSSEYLAGYELALGPERQIRNVATVQQMTVVEGAGGSQGLYAFRLRSAEAVNLGPNASMEVGNEVQSVHGPDEVTSSLPFVNASWHSDGAVVSYRLATSPELQNAGNSPTAARWRLCSLKRTAM